MQSGRVFNNPKRVPAAVRYYKRLAREGDLRYRIAPFDGPDAEHYFQYDLAINSAPLRFERPGPTVRIYHLRNCVDRAARGQPMTRYSVWNMATATMTAVASSVSTSSAKRIVPR